MSQRWSEQEKTNMENFQLKLNILLLWSFKCQTVVFYKMTLKKHYISRPTAHV